MAKQTAFRLSDRAAGVLLHPTSLPGPHGSGDLGPDAHAFIDFLAAAGQRWWQMLPTAPPGLGHSPYSPLSAFAGGPHLISLTELRRAGLLKPNEIKPPTNLRDDRVVFARVFKFRQDRLRIAFDRFVAQGGRRDRAFNRYRASHADWLDDWALYATLKRHDGDSDWMRWPKALRLREPKAVAAISAEFADELEFERFLQFEYDRQWSNLRQHAHARAVGLVGDIPIFVATDSADVWSRPELFVLDARRRPKIVTGVPPDLFSKDGQLWNHPHYDWARHRRTNWAWWIARCRRLVEQFDAARIDHFLGFYRLWAVSAKAKTARRGKWIPTPGDELLAAVTGAIGRVEIIAEDLGLVTPQAVALREKYSYPGMRLLLNAFHGASHYDEPHEHPRDCVLYTGTHDNESAMGWYRRIKRESRKHRNGLSQYNRMRVYTGCDGSEPHWDLIRCGYASPANTFIVPAQDLLGLDNRARMNMPGIPDGNWTWRLPPGSLTGKIAARLRDLATVTDRLRGPADRARNQT